MYMERNEDALRNLTIAQLANRAGQSADEEVDLP